MHRNQIMQIWASPVTGDLITNFFYILSHFHETFYAKHSVGALKELYCTGFVHSVIFGCNTNGSN